MSAGKISAVPAVVAESFTDAHLQEICKVLGDAASGTEITALLREAGMVDPMGEGTLYQPPVDT